MNTYLGTNLVTTLSSLEMNNFSHFECLNWCSCRPEQMLYAVNVQVECVPILHLYTLYRSRAPLIDRLWLRTAHMAYIRTDRTWLQLIIGSLITVCKSFEHSLLNRLPEWQTSRLRSDLTGNTTLKNQVLSYTNPTTWRVFYAHLFII